MFWSYLKSWDLFAKFLFLISKLEKMFKIFLLFSTVEKLLQISRFFCKLFRSLLEPENRSRRFSFLFLKFKMWIPYFSFSSRFDFWHLVNAWGKMILSRWEIPCQGSSQTPSRWAAQLQRQGNREPSSSLEDPQLADLNISTGKSHGTRRWFLKKILHHFRQAF